MTEFYFGSHMSTGNIIEAAKLVKNAGGNLIQIFLTSPGEKYIGKKSLETIKDFKNFMSDNNMKVVVHSSYLHNFAQNWDEYSWWITNFEIEIEYADLIGAIGVVLHFGKYKELTMPEAINNMYTSLIYVHNHTIEHKNVKIILETSTGQGTEMFYQLQDMAHFFKKFSQNINKEVKKRFRLCIDTCHIFAAGYDLRNKTAIKTYLESLEELIGIQYIALVHLNDCKVSLGCKKDRHQNIGKGFIGLEGLKLIFDYFKKLKVPIILETPGNGYITEIPLLLGNI